MENLANKNSSVSEELLNLFQADQEDRKKLRAEKTDWDEVRPRDEARLKRVKELYEEGLIKTADDMFYTALIFQHGGSSEAYKIAMELTRKAMEMGHESAKKLFPRTEDRYLLSMGKPQIWGTQFRKNENGRWQLIEPFDRNTVSEEKRKEFGVDPEKDLKELNSRN